MPFAPDKACSQSIDIIAGQLRRLIRRMKTLPVQRCTKRATKRGKEEAITDMVRPHGHLVCFGQWVSGCRATVALAKIRVLYKYGNFRAVWHIRTSSI